MKSNRRIAAVRLHDHVHDHGYSQADPRGVVAGRRTYEPTQPGSEKAFSERPERIRRVPAGEE
jgi:hypothetical protein